MFRLFLKLHNKKQYMKIKKMPSSPRLIGLELEFDNSRINISRSDLKRKLNVIARRENQRVISNEQSDAWTLKNDHCGFEFTSPAIPSSLSNFIKIKNIVNGLKDICREYRSEGIPEHQTVCSPMCGMHVHIKINDLNLKQIRNLVNIFLTYENALLSIQAPSRSNNGFVYLLQDNNDIIENQRTKHEIISALRNHYSAVSFTRYNSRKTIEIRYGSATVVGRKVINWIQLLVLLVEIAKYTGNQDHIIQYSQNQTFDNLKQFIMENETGTWLDGRKENLITWMDRRIEQIAEFTAATELRRQQNNNNETNN